MAEVIISNPSYFESTKKAIIEAGADNLHVIADFDRTLTYAHSKTGERIPSLISVLRNENYLSEEYSVKAKALAAKYNVIENDASIPVATRKAKMKEWWTLHNKILIEYGLNKKHVQRVVDSGIIRLRQGAGEFMDFLKSRGIPLVIMSSSGIGNAIPMFLEKQGKMYDNIYIIANIWKWDENGNATGLEGAIIHSMNKDTTGVKDFPSAYKAIKDRKNVLLLGDSLGDVGMAQGFPYKNLIKIGFLNEKVEESLDFYKKEFDVIITHDDHMHFIKDLLKEIK
jgi:5'-nucleotidase